MPAFGLLAPTRGLRRTENPRVGGSIPPLATTSNFLKRNGFPASPADYRGTAGPRIDRPPDYRKSGRSPRVRGAMRAATSRAGNLESWDPRGAARGGSTQARRCPEWPRGAQSRRGHAGPHGPAARLPRGRRDSTSEEARAGARESVHPIGLARSLRNACNRRNTRVRRVSRFTAFCVRCRTDATARARVLSRLRGRMRPSNVR